MAKLNYELLHQYIEDFVVAPFYQKRTEKLEELRLADILKRKNPYLFKAKNIRTAGDFAKDLLNAHLSSQEETIFGDLLEGLAIHINATVFGGHKAEQKVYKSVDLIFDNGNTRYAVGIKSGPNWGNSDQINIMKDNFKKAKELLRKEGWAHQIFCVNGCMYGKDKNSYKEDKEDPERSYFKYCGQEFWQFISGDKELYQTIIIPLDKEVKKRDDAFKDLSVKVTNQLTKDLLDNFTDKSYLDWRKILEYVSKKQ
jgi:site-specific DNA-methyltransferase (cytosine-N4-specific)